MLKNTRSFEVDSSHMNCVKSSQVKSFEFGQVDLRSTWGHFSFKWGHISWPQQLAGLGSTRDSDNTFKVKGQLAGDVGISWRPPAQLVYLGWMCGVDLNERKNSEELWELLWLEPVNLMIKMSRLRWFVHVERKNWVRRCVMWEVEGITQKKKISHRH